MGCTNIPPRWVPLGLTENKRTRWHGWQNLTFSWHCYWSISKPERNRSTTMINWANERSCPWTRCEQNIPCEEKRNNWRWSAIDLRGRSTRHETHGSWLCAGFTPQIVVDGDCIHDWTQMISWCDFGKVFPATVVPVRQKNEAGCCILWQRIVIILQQRWIGNKVIFSDRPTSGTKNGQ